MLLPNFYFDNVVDIDVDFLKKYKVKAVLLDIDNTLTNHNGIEPYCRVREWVDRIKGVGVKVAIISNSKDENRVRFFADKLSIDDYVWNAKKPTQKGFDLLAEMLGINKNKFWVVGDQVFTDILGANLAGGISILVEAKDKNEPISIKIKRVLEFPIKSLRKFKNKK